MTVELLKGYVLSVLDVGFFLELMEVLFLHEERHRFSLILLKHNSFRLGVTFHEFVCNVFAL